MLNFKDFINEGRANNIVFAGWNSYGYVTVYIDGKKYVYYTDAVYIRPIWRKAKFAPGKALADLKKCSELVESPEINKKIEEPKIPAKPIQKTLF